MKATAVAPANIAFIKYWGKKDERLRLPLNSSVSMNLSGAFSTTTVEFHTTYTRDVIEMTGEALHKQEITRIKDHLDRIRVRANIDDHARVVTKNSFPKGTGAASSASGFAALTMAASSAASLHLQEKELTILARLGSGSACRSIPDGFVLWEAGNSSNDSYAYSLFPHSYWDMQDVLVVVDSTMKKVSTTDGMKGVATSSKLDARLFAIPKRITSITDAFEKKNFKEFGKVLEQDCLDMHHVMQTQSPPLNYWNPTTKRIMNAVIGWRRSGIPVYFTIDAGPNVHVITEGKNVKSVTEHVQTVEGVENIMCNKPAPGAHIIRNHLF